LPVSIRLAAGNHTTVNAIGAPTPPPAESWTPFTHTLGNSDGTSTTSFHLLPAYRNNGGGWTAVDNTVKALSDVTHPLSAEGALRPIRFGVAGNDLVELGLDGGPVTLSSSGLNVGVPALSGNGVRYAGVASGTDLQYTVGAAGLEEQILLGSSLAPTSFSFHLADPSGQLGTIHSTPMAAMRSAAALTARRRSSSSRPTRLRPLPCRSANRQSRTRAPHT
jgi:hypothetical protein